MLFNTLLFTKPPAFSKNSKPQKLQKLITCPRGVTLAGELPGQFDTVSVDTGVLSHGVTECLGEHTGELYRVPLVPGFTHTAVGRVVVNTLLVVSHTRDGRVTRVV